MRLLRAIALSLLLHLLIGSCLKLIHTEPRLPLLPPPLASQVEFIEDPELREKRAPREQELQIVRSQNLPKEVLKPRTAKDKVRFFSESEQTVLEEERAQESGLTQNRAQESFQQQEQAQQESGSKKTPQIFTPGTEQVKNPVPAKDLKRFSIDRDQRFLNNDSKVGDIALNEFAHGDGKDDEFIANNQARPLKFPKMNAYQLNAGRSTVGESLPNDIKFGQMTALNSDRFTYYSFYSRAEELIRPHWETQVRSALYTYERTSAVTGDEIWLTRLEIILDKEGRFLKGIVDQRSGLDSLDLSPVLAFRAAGQIPHPPPELVAADGLIHLNYEFAVRYMRQLARGSRDTF